MPASAVVLERVEKRFGNVTVVRDVSLAIEPGELVCLLGPSGSGKTTTLRMIAGFERPTGGDIRIGEQSVLGLEPRLRNLGMVAQDYALFPHMTVFQNVAFGLRMRKVPAPELARRVRETLAIVEMEHLADRFPNQLSGGQKQRVAFARAVVTEPSVLLMDEPFGALDRQLREHMQVEVKLLQQRLGITTILVTHDQDEAMSLSDRVVIMDRGEIQQVGSPREVYETPHNQFVANFIGLSNFFEAVVREVSGLDLVAEVPEGPLIRLRGGGRAEPGRSVKISLRPEVITVTTAADQERGDLSANHVEGSIISVIYQGPVTQWYVQAAPGWVVKVVRPSTDAATRSLRVGERVNLRWASDQCLVFEG